MSGLANLGLGPQKYQASLSPESLDLPRDLLEKASPELCICTIVVIWYLGTNVGSP